MITDPVRDRSPLKIAAVGVASGLVASFAMDRFQAAVAALSKSTSGGKPATDKAAERIALATTGARIAEHRRPAAGQLVHYLFGAGLGAGYALIAEREPKVTGGWGAPFGLGVAAVFDEAGVPLAGLGKPPWQTPASTHLYTAASHVVFGLTLEAARLLLDRFVTGPAWNSSKPTTLGNSAVPTSAHLAENGNVRPR